MGNFLDMIDRARADDVSTSIWQHLQHWEYQGDGAPRPLTGTELAIVRDVINDYTLVRLLTVYGAEDVTHLCQCLSDAIKRDHPASVSTALLEQALLCIRALETELTKERDAIELWREASEHEGGA